MKISVIVPVYNVVEWLDECLNSIVGQTYQDFEVLLIDDGSTDGSGLKCDKWKEKDARIKVVHKENEGLSPTRNLGLSMAKGDYISFIDPDDWVDRTFLEKLYKKIAETGVSVAESDIIRYNQKTGEITYKISSGCIGLKESLEAHMIYGNTTLCKCLIEKKLFDIYHIRFPECHSPARGIYALLVALSGRIENVNEGLYYYRIFRPGSLSEKPRENIEDTEIGIKTFEFLVDGFRRCDIYSKYASILEQSIRFKLSDMLAAFYNRYDKASYQAMYESYCSFLKRMFPETAYGKEYITLGGYNLNRITWSMNCLHNPYCRFNFSSLISIMNPTSLTGGVKHKNRYRETMLQRDIQSEFWNILREVQPQFIIMDFLEERFSMIQTEDGYITQSDAWDESENHLTPKKTLMRNSKECTELWERCCEEFINQMEKEFPQVTMILVKNYLSTTYGNIHSTQKYEDQEEIESSNRALKHYYEYFEKTSKKIQTVETCEEKYYFTDEKYTYGVIPPHLNDIVNRNIAKKIEEIMEKSVKI